MEYSEEDFLNLAGLQHFAFCRRQWALAYVEMQWLENLRTVQGHILHDNAHDPFSAEKRGSLIISRGMAVFSRTLGVNGVCDVVE
ncbi:MAG TPA: CRISPR-associated protein Cas4, partial [Ruminococcaceae bacterium]|nr:CRISPR-associated protein Cas4 [Oscillospiraceae bacterium]